MTSPQTDIANRIKTALAEYLKRDVSTIKPSHALREDLGLDSMATIELLFQIEEVFGLQIPDQDLSKLATVGDVIAYVERRLAPSSPSPAKQTAERAGRKKKK